VRSKIRVFFLLAILIFIIHFLATFYAADLLTTTLDRNAPIEARFAPSFAIALCTLPLLQLTVLNSIIIAIIAAWVFTYLRWRALLAIVIGVPLLLLIGVTATATVLEHGTERGWRELAPHPIEPAPRGTLETSLGNQPIEPLNSYLTKQIARGDDRVDPLPQEADWFLVAHRSEIDALRHQLPVTADPLARFRMQKILLVDALQSRSWEEVNAAERVTDALLHQPNFNSVLYAIAATKNQLGVMRKLGPPARAPIPSYDPHQRLIDAIAAQDAHILKISSPWYARPYARLCLAESAYSALRQAMLIRELRGRRVDVPAEHESKAWVPFNPMGVLGGGARYAIRANQLLLDRERTAVSLASRKPS